MLKALRINDKSSNSILIHSIFAQSTADKRDPSFSISILDL